MTATAQVLIEVHNERRRQDAKWGIQDHPDLPARWVGRSPDLVAKFMGTPIASLAKALCEYEHEVHGVDCWALIDSEENSEAYEQAALGNLEELRKELIQGAAVKVAWVEAIDRRLKKAANVIALPARKEAA